MPFVDISLLVISSLLGLFLAIFIARHRRAPGSQALSVLILGASLWSMGYAFEIASVNPAVKQFWEKFEYIGIVIIPLAWLMFVAQYLGDSKWIRLIHRYRLWLMLVPALTLLLVWTNDLHHLIWELKESPTGSMLPLEFDHGPWFWVLMAYSYLLLLAGSLKLGVSLFGIVKLQRWQVILALVAILLPWISNIMYLTGITPTDYILDWTAFVFLLSGVLFAISLFRFQLVNIVPIAQEKVFAGLADCVVVLDLNGIIVDMNPIAKEMVEFPWADGMGRNISLVMPELAEHVKLAGNSKEYKAEFTSGEEPGQDYYDLHISLLTTPNLVPIGRVLVLHQITQHKRDQAELERARNQLEAVVEQRTEELRQSNEQMRTLALRLQELEEAERQELAVELHDRVGQNLTGLNLNLKILQDQLLPGCAPEIHRRLDESLTIVEETTHKIRDVMSDLYPPVLDEYGLLAAIKWYGADFGNRAGIQTVVNGSRINPRPEPGVEKILYRMVQESLTNITKHAQASEVHIQVESTPEVLSVQVKDNGVGFDPHQITQLKAHPHWGFLSMQQRAASIGADLDIDSVVGKGTQVTVKVPRNHHGY